ncbi:MAG TPA: hypothetical protein VF267_10435 [Gammaproteobacteria bacterium]
MSVRQRVQQAMNQIDALSLRERAFVMLGAFMVLFLAWDSLLMSDIGARGKTLNADIEAIQGRMSQLGQAIANAAQNRTADPNTLLDDELAALKLRTAQVDGELAARARHVIPPREMANVLEEVLQRQKRLELLRVESLPPEPLFQDAADGDENAPAAVYRHGLELEVRGSYMNVLAYLREIESLEWQFFWEAVTLESGKYPENRVRIRVYSLNLEEGWLGV